jgi:AraC family transcriptional regulator, transcriptional activator of pobA
MEHSLNEKYTFGNSHFILHKKDLDFSQAYSKNKVSPLLYTIVFNFGASQKVIIDNCSYTMQANVALPLMINQDFKFELPDQIIAIQFNKEFYCIVEHDSEVGCVGFLFYGLTPAVFIPISQNAKAFIQYQLSQIEEELGASEDLKGAMIRTYLAGIIISLTRLAKKQLHNIEKESEAFYLLRHFNLLIEKHYKNERNVKFYSDKLNKSPKTLSHVCAHYAKRPPIKIIHNRVSLEAKRLLYYSDLSVKEISTYLGFEDSGQFSKFFKNCTNQNPTTCRLEAKREKAHSSHLETANS